MRFKSVCVESIGFCLPKNRIASSDIEQQLAPLYQRLRLPEGRLELMLQLAADGDMAAIKEIGDRLDGKPTQQIAGDPDNPVTLIYKSAIAREQNG